MEIEDIKLENNTKKIQDQEWFDMPEFVQEKLEPYAKIIIRVDNKDDLEDLAKRLNQPLTQKTKSAWHPYRSHFRETQQPEWTTHEE
jgi:hypothetical protein